ncbi:regulatory protein recX-like, partial [Trifolium medium]|nr:regulatory protein recX-like [Trifolium medium]
ALFMKGVSQADAEKAVEVVFKDNNDCVGDEKSIVGLSKQSMDHLYVQASKQWSRGQNVPLETRKSRIIRWLQYRGFDWNVISIILKKLDKHEQNPP